MTGPATRTEPRDAVNGAQGLFRKPLRVFLLATGVALLLGVLYGLLESSNIAPDLLQWLLMIASILLVLGIAAVSVVAAVGAIKPQEAFDEFFLSMVGAVCGVIIFIPITCAFVVGLTVRLMIGVEEVDNEAYSHWAGYMLTIMMGAGILSVVVGAPVGLIAWISRFARP
jgi:magnesium-transporting ATPase (P-type)